MFIKRYDEISEAGYMAYITEWEASGIGIVPYSSRRAGESFNSLQARWRDIEARSMFVNNLVPATLYFLVDEHNEVGGAIDVRYGLNDYLSRYGGHIGYGIRPSWRKKGCGVKMLELVLLKLKKSNLTEVLITCDDDNIGSIKVIEANGGVLESKIDENGRLVRRYWIEIGR